MKIKDLFVLVEKHNELAELIGGERMVIETRQCCDYHAFETFKEYKSYLKEEVFETAIKSYVDIEYVKKDKGGNGENEFVGTFIFDGETRTIELSINQI